MPEALAERIAALQAGGLVLSASVEAEIAGLAPDEQDRLLAEGRVIVLVTFTDGTTSQVLVP